MLNMCIISKPSPLYKLYAGPSLPYRESFLLLECMVEKLTGMRSQRYQGPVWLLLFSMCYLCLLLMEVMQVS